MSRLIQTLMGIGFSEKAAQLYVAALGCGTASIQTLAERAGIKRPTAYNYVQELIQLGVMERVPLGKKELFHVSHPELLSQRAKQNVDVLEGLMPTLLGMEQRSSGRPGVKVLYGKRGLEEVYREIAKAPSIRFWSDLAAFEANFKEMFEEFSEAIQRKEIRTREIIPDTASARRSSKRYALVAGKFYSSRLATKNGIMNDSAIFSDVVALFRIHEFNLYVVRIQDVTIASTMRALFDMAWQAAKPFIN